MHFRSCANMRGMKNTMHRTAIKFLAAMASLASAASAQTPAPAAPPAAPVSIAVANPAYVSIPMEIAVNKPAAEVWKRVGKYCDIGEWARFNCTITAGKDGELGAVRSVGKNFRLALRRNGRALAQASSAEHRADREPGIG